MTAIEHAACLGQDANFLAAPAQGRFGVQNVEWLHSLRSTGRIGCCGKLGTQRQRTLVARIYRQQRIDDAQ